MWLIYTRHLRIDVPESQSTIIIVDDVCRDLLGDNLVKDGRSALVSGCYCPAAHDEHGSEGNILHHPTIQISKNRHVRNAVLEKQD